MAMLAGKAITTNGLGVMRFTVPPVFSDELAFKLLKAAIANGANVWNGADFYGLPDSNSLHLMNRYFTAYPEDADKVVLCIKTCVVSMATLEIDDSPATVRKMVDTCNAILDGKKTIDLCGPARVDPKVPIEETIKAFGELVEEGKIGGIQLSEVSADTIRRAAKVYKIDMVEAEVSLWATDIFTNGVAQVCNELGIVISAHSPLGAGMLTGRYQKLDDMPENDHHRFFPRYQGENFDTNLQLVRHIQALAERKNCTPSQLALSWLKAQGRKPGMPFIVPIAGTRSVERLRENCQDIGLDEDDMKAISDVLDKFPVAGARWPPAAAGFAEY